MKRPRSEYIDDVAIDEDDNESSGSECDSDEECSVESQTSSQTANEKMHESVTRLQYEDVIRRLELQNATLDAVYDNMKALNKIVKELLCKIEKLEKK